MIIGFLWDIAYQICDRFLLFEQHILHKFGNSEFIVSGFFALVTIYLTRKEKIDGAVGKLSLILAAVPYLCFIGLGLLSFL